MSRLDLPPSPSSYDVERVLEFEFVRATENAALNAIHWLGRPVRIPDTLPTLTP